MEKCKLNIVGRFILSPVGLGEADKISESGVFEIGRFAEKGTVVGVGRKDLQLYCNELFALIPSNHCWRPQMGDIVFNIHSGNYGVVLKTGHCTDTVFVLSGEDTELHLSLTYWDRDDMNTISEIKDEHWRGVMQNMNLAYNPNTCEVEKVEAPLSTADFKHELQELLRKYDAEIEIGDWHSGTIEFLIGSRVALRRCAPVSDGSLDE